MPQFLAGRCRSPAQSGSLDRSPNSAGIAAELLRLCCCRASRCKRRSSTALRPRAPGSPQASPWRERVRQAVQGWQASPSRERVRQRGAGLAGTTTASASAVALARAAIRPSGQWASLSERRATARIQRPSAARHGAGAAGGVTAELRSASAARAVLRGQAGEALRSCARRSRRDCRSWPEASSCRQRCSPPRKRGWSTRSSGRRRSHSTRSRCSAADSHTRRLERRTKPFGKGSPTGMPPAPEPPAPAMLSLPPKASPANADDAP